MLDITRVLRSVLMAGLLPLAFHPARAADRIDINTADVTTLDRVLLNIGPAKAQAIVEFRQKNGPFKSPEDLLKVDGIGERVLEQNRGNIRLNAAGAAPAPAGKASPRPASRPVAPSAGH
jgi:competence protein ComEA